MINRNRLEDEGGHVLSEFFGGYESLEMLEVSGNSIRGESMTALINSLQGHAKAGNLVHLDIGDNFVDSDEAVDALCELIKVAS